MSKLPLITFAVALATHHAAALSPPSQFFAAVCFGAALGEENLILKTDGGAVPLQIWATRERHFRAQLTPQSQSAYARNISGTAQSADRCYIQSEACHDCMATAECSMIAWCASHDDPP